MHIHKQLQQLFRAWLFVCVSFNICKRTHDSGIINSVRQSYWKNRSHPKLYPIPDFPNVRLVNLLSNHVNFYDWLTIITTADQKSRHDNYILYPKPHLVDNSKLIIQEHTQFSPLTPSQYSSVRHTRYAHDFFTVFFTRFTHFSDVLTHEIIIIKGILENTFLIY